jgi:hypothetical protein
MVAKLVLTSLSAAPLRFAPRKLALRKLEPFSAACCKSAFCKLLSLRSALFNMV